MIIGTAGHIDHGKSALITALTGRPMDRLAEERRRGITIELGFAPLDLGRGRMAAVIDVPGHEDFIRTMVAGASGIDVALLVVAADEGIMPQTEEHLLVLEQLGISRGIAVVTKSDLVEADWAALVVAELAGRLARSSVRFGEPALVSVRSGDGVDALRARLVAEIEAVPPRIRDDLFRLPADRAFSLAGVGTIVTGTCWSGAIEVGAEVRVLPSGRRGRVRTVESFGAPIAAAAAGARVALGIAGLERADVGRGAVVVSADAPWEESRVVDALLRLDAGAPRPIVRRTRIRVHLGTGEVMAWATPRGPIAPGGAALARLQLERPLAARGGDRFVLRAFSPVAAIGGGVVVDPLPPARCAAWPEELASGDTAARLRALLARRPRGLAVAQLPLLLGVPGREAERHARADASIRRLGEMLVAESIVQGLGLRMSAALAEHHRTHRADRGMPLETLRRAALAPAWIAEAALGDLVARGSVVVADGLARERAFRPQVAGGDAIVERAVAEVERAGLAPPSVDELAVTLGRPDAAAVLRLAAASGRVEALERDRYFSRTALELFVATVREVGAGGEISVGALRDRLGISRKFLIPLLEWADSAGVTVRNGDTRRLRAVGTRAP